MSILRAERRILMALLTTIVMFILIIISFHSWISGETVEAFYSLLVAFYSLLVAISTQLFEIERKLKK